MQSIDNTTDGTEGSSKARSLGLTTPQRTPPPEHSMFMVANETAAWIAALPLANVGETSRQVYTTLGDFNQCELPVKTRAKETERFRPVVAYIAENLRRHFMGMSFPLSQKGWKTLILSRELNNELAISYKILIEDLLANREGRLDRKLLIIALHRALYYLGQVYLQTCLSYTASPPDLWREINTLFAFARQNRVHRVAVRMKTNDMEETSTIEDRYKALMLFATATPARLPQIHLESTFRKTLEWAALTRFLDPQEGDSEVDTLNVNLRGDEPPIHNAFRKPGQDSRWAILDASELIRKLQQQYREAPPDGSKQAKFDSSRIPGALLRLLIRGWHVPSERQFHRTQLNFSLQILCGLSAIHSTLVARKNGADRSGAGDPGSIYDVVPTTDAAPLSLMETGGDSSLSLLEDSEFSANLAPSPGRGGHTEWMADYGGSQPPPGEVTSTDNLHPGLSADGGQHPNTTVTTLNESANGFCIRWSDERLPKTRVGELVAVGSDDPAPGFRLGVVRWLHSINQTEMEVGLQIISHQVRAARIYEAIAEGRVPLRNKHDPITGLRLNSGSRNGKREAPSLVLASTAHTLGTYLWLEDVESGELRLIRLSRLIDFSGAFARFEFKYIDKQAGKGADSGNDRSEFENLWNSL